MHNSSVPRLIADPERPLIMHQGVGNAPTTPSAAGIFYDYLRF